MKKLKSVLSLLLCAAILLLGTACGEGNSAKEEYEGIDISIGYLKGAYSMGLAKLMETAAALECANEYTFTPYETEEELKQALSDNSVDVATLSVTGAAELYGEGADIKMLAADTLAGLWIIENGSTVRELSQMTSGTIGVVGADADEYTLRFLLRMCGADVSGEAQFNYYADEQTLADALSSGEVQLALLSEPYATGALLQNTELSRAVDLGEEWRIYRDMELPTFCFASTASLAEENTVQTEKLLEELETSVKYSVSQSEKNAELCERREISEKALTDRLLSENSSVLLKGSYMQKSVVGYYSMLLTFDRNLFGGKQPAADFYF